nr:RNA-directed DNA polymerase, eukaryota [Tanacetum cinerariifolium]
RDLSKCAMGSVKDVNLIPNMQVILADEGFDDVIQEVPQDFVSKERVVWVDIEGIPLYAWSSGTFSRIGKKWGEMLDFEDSSDSSFGRKDNSSSLLNQKEVIDEQQSADPFKIYEILNKKKSKVERKDSVQSMTHPSGFTPQGYEAKIFKNQVNGEDNVNLNKEFSPKISAKVMNQSQPIQGEASFNSVGQSTINKGGSVLGVLEEVIRVGQAMGYSMEGCEKDIESIIKNKGDDDSLGNSGGILCIWEETIFKKDQVTISDYFVAIYGSWIPNKAKILIVAIYDPQDPNSDERHGSCFNLVNARIFDNFISSSSLIDVKMEGYAFTWSHPSANKMSKLDRFLVSDGVISLFPSITAFCLDRHLSDHRPILLCEVRLDFGPVPFRIYHSWFKFAVFEDMVVQTWNCFSFSDRNGMIRFNKKLQEIKKSIRGWIKDKNNQLVSSKRLISNEMWAIDKQLEEGGVSDSLLLRRN